MREEYTLLDSLTEDSPSLAELLGMEETDTQDIAVQKRMAENGNKNMITYLGLRYLKGDGVPQDIAEALFWLEQSDSGIAAREVADFYEMNGENALAQEWYLKAAKDKENACNAYIRLTLLELEKTNETYNVAEADNYLRAAFESSPNEKETRILYDLCDLLLKIMDRKDEDRYLFWLMKSLEHKEDSTKRAMADNIYGRILISEESSEKLRQEAAVYFDQREDQVMGTPVEALFHYYSKDGMDAQKRIFWTKRAADAGNANAQMVLSMAYLGKNYNRKIILEQDLDACERYAALLEKNAKANAKDKEIVVKIRNTIRQEKEVIKAQSEKHLTEKEAKVLWEEVLKNGGKVLRIPDGYTHIDSCAFRFWKTSSPILKDLTKLEEVIIPDSVRVIEPVAFSGVAGLTKIKLPANLEYLGIRAFSGNYFGLFGVEAKDKRTVEKLIIPKDCEVAVENYKKHAFTDIYGIKELIFEEGRKSINCTMFCSVHIDHLYIPDSVTEYKNPEIADCKIKMISAPAHLKPQISKMKVSKRNITYR